MTKCFLCDSQMSNIPADPHCDSAEHIFPNAIGGQKVVSGFICRKCNSTTGETWDAALAEQMQPLGLILGVSRDRGVTPPLKITTTKGERVTWHGQGGLSYTDPEFERRERPDGSAEYRIRARSVGEARSMLEGLKRKHPKLDVEAALAQATGVEKYLDGDFHFSFQFGGPEGGRSVVKTCLAFAFANDIDWRHCNHAISYLRDPEGKACFGYFSSRDLISGRKPGVPLHCIGLRADPHSGLILAYAEYFSVTRIVACLGEGYLGDLIEKVYAFDPRTGDEQNVGLSLTFDRDAIESIYAYDYFDGKQVETAFSALLGPALKAQADAERSRVINLAVEKAFQNCGVNPNQILTEDQICKFRRSILESIMPLMRHQLRSIKSPIERGGA